MPNPSTPGRHLQRHRLPDGFPYLQMDWRQSDAPILRLHRHNVLEIGYCHAGEGIFAFADKVLPFAAGAVSVVSPAEYHFARSRAGSVSHWTFCFLQPLALVATPGGERALLDDAELRGPRFANILEPDEHPEICRLVAVLVAEGARQAPGWRSVVRGLVQALLALLHRLPRGGDEDGFPGRRRAADAVAPALELMLADPATPVDVDVLAASCDLGRRSFERAFLRATGSPPKQYLLLLRVQQAAALLRAGHEVLDAGLSVGFATPSAFYRQFRKHFGCAPRTWRRRLEDEGS